MTTRRLTTDQVNAVLSTMELRYKNMSLDEQRAILYKIGVPKINIEALDEDGLLARLKSEYEAVIRGVDLNSFSVHTKYKEGAEFVSGENKTDLKAEITKYKNA